MMKTVYRVLAYLIALEVVVQAAMAVYAVAGLAIWVDRDGGVLDKAAFESEETLFPEVVGFMVHGMNGTTIIPALALVFLIVSFFAKVPGGWKWALGTLVLVLVQVLLGLFGHEHAVFGLLHGVNALLLFGAALLAGMRVKKVTMLPGSYTAEERELV